MHIELDPIAICNGCELVRSFVRFSVPTISRAYYGYPLSVVGLQYRVPEVHARKCRNRSIRVEPDIQNGSSAELSRKRYRG